MASSLARSLSVITTSSEQFDYLREILNSRVYDAAIESPLSPATSLSAKVGCDVFIKREDCQPVFSFKIRGAYNKIVSLNAEQRRRGVVACSAGNHAPGAATSSAGVERRLSHIALRSRGGSGGNTQARRRALLRLARNPRGRGHAGRDDANQGRRGGAARRGAARHPSPSVGRP